MRFRDSDILKKPKLTHAEEKQHLCPECGKRFTQAGRMRMRSSSRFLNISVVY